MARRIVAGQSCRLFLFGFLDAVEVVPAAFDNAGADAVPARGVGVLGLRDVGLDLCQDGRAVLRGEKAGSATRRRRIRVRRATASPGVDPAHPSDDR